MPRAKKTYICSVCGKQYLGYRRSGTCSQECSLKKFVEHIQKVRNPETLEYKKACEAGIKFRQQFEKRKGKWFKRWLMKMKFFISSLERR